MVSYLVPLSSYGATSEPLHNSLGQHCALQFSVSRACSATPAFCIVIHIPSQLLPCGQCFPFVERVSFSYLNSHFLCFLWVSGRCHFSKRPFFFSKHEDFITLSVLWAPFSFPTCLQSTGFGTCWHLDIRGFVLLVVSNAASEQRCSSYRLPQTSRKGACLFSPHHHSFASPLQCGSSP